MYSVCDTKTKWFTLFRLMILHQTKRGSTVGGQNADLFFTWDTHLLYIDAVEEQELSITAMFVYFTVDYINTCFGFLKKVKHVTL
jgi:hypothetical protein